MTAALTSPRRHAALVYAREAGVGLVISAPVAVVMTAAAALILEILAIPLALVATRDLYVALLAPSFGLYAAGLVLLWVVVASACWSILRPASRAMPPQGAVMWYSAMGVFVTLCGWLLLLFWAPDATTLFRWHYGPLPRVTPINGALVLLGGAIAGAVSAARNVRRSVGGAVLPSWRLALRDLAWFAFVLALGLEGWVALLAAFGAA